MSNYWTGKGKGEKIVLKFNKALLGDVTGNEAAFTVTGMERDPLKYGTPKARAYAIQSIERYPLTRYWQDDFDGQMDGLELGVNGITLYRPESEVSITDSKCYETTSGKTLTGTVTAKAGDIVLATISHRSVFTMPAGWTKLYESELIPSYTQKMIFAIKTIETAGSVSFTATQSTAARIYLNLIAISGAKDIVYADDLETFHGTNVSVVNAKNKAPGKMLIWGCSACVWLTAGGVWATSPNDLTLVSLPSNIAARQANFIDAGGGAATGRTFTPATSTDCVAAAVELILHSYAEEGTYTATLPTDNLTDPRLRFDAYEPEGTSITAAYACTDNGGPPDTWTPFDDRDLLDVTGDTLHLRFTFATEDEGLTPTLQAVWIEEAEAPPDKLLITMTQAGRFNDTEGSLTITYERAKGTLTGTRPVEDFEETFTPTDLEPTPLNVQGTITAGIELEVDFIEVDHIDLGHKNTITAGITVEVDLIPVSEIPP